MALPASLNPKHYFEIETITAENPEPLASWPDSSGNGITLSQPTAANQPAKSIDVDGTGSAVRFDGFQHQFVTANFASTIGAGAFSAWFLIRPDTESISGFRGFWILGGGNNIHLAIQANLIRFVGTGFPGAGTPGISPITPDEWHVLVLTRTAAGLITLYVDGVADAVTPTNTTDYGASVSVGLGYISNQFNGYIRDYGMVERLLSPAEISDLTGYLSGRTTIPVLGLSGARISIVFVVGGVPKNADGGARLRDATGTYGINNNATGATVVTSSGAISPVSGTGVYEYGISDLLPGSYTAVWQFIDSATGTVYVPTLFTIDAAIGIPDGVTLTEIEQYVARLTGPYARERVSDALATVSTATLGRLRSRLTTGQYEDLFLLRRGVKQDGSAIQGFIEDDRIRLISQFDNSLGAVQVDRDWTTAPVENEMIEIMHLHPEDIRFAVQEGVKRCFFLDLVSVATTAAAAQRDLAVALPWLRNPEWIYGAEWSFPNQTTMLPGDVGWHTAHREGSAVMFRAAGDPYPNTLKLKVARPFSTFVNGVTSVVGPNDDNDIVPGPVDYIAKAAHVECWRFFPDRMLAAAEEGYRLGRKEAVEAFEAASFDVFKTFPARTPQAADPYGWLSALASVRVN